MNPIDLKQWRAAAKYPPKDPAVRPDLYLVTYAFPAIGILCEVTGWHSYHKGKLCLRVTQLHEVSLSSGRKIEIRPTDVRYLRVMNEVAKHVELPPQP